MFPTIMLPLPGAPPGPAKGITRCRTSVRTLLPSLLLLACTSVIGNTLSSHPQISFLPRARYYNSQGWMLDSLPTCLVLVRNDDSRSVRLCSSEDGYPLIRVRRFWRGREGKNDQPLLPGTGKTALAPGDSIYVEVPLLGLDVDAFLLEVQGAPAAAETAVSVRSDTIMVMNAPYISLVSGEEAVSALREILPAARCPFRPRGLSFDCGSGPVWRLEYRLPGTSGGSPRGGTAVVRALDGSVAAWGASGKATGASRDPSASGEARH